MHKSTTATDLREKEESPEAANSLSSRKPEATRTEKEKRHRNNGAEKQQARARHIPVTRRRKGA